MHSRDLFKQFVLDSKTHTTYSREEHEQKLTLYSEQYGSLFNMSSQRLRKVLSLNILAIKSFKLTNSSFASSTFTPFLKMMWITQLISVHINIIATTSTHCSNPPATFSGLWRSVLREMQGHQHHGPLNLLGSLASYRD